MPPEAKNPFSFPKMEEEILEYWNKNKIFEKSVTRRQIKGEKNKKFIFFEGPPTANNVPHMGHFETRAFKDIVLRYKTMRGYFVPRRAGWDTHGLPVEVEVEKTLGLKNKKDIEKYGVAAFNKKCRESVWKYKELWERMTSRMGFWIDMSRPYITYENSYIESLWHIVKGFANKKYLYEDYKIVPWCARCGTALSSHEVAQGYEKTTEESVYVKFKIKGEENTYFLVWTTTPWTLPGNVALAVNPKIDYVVAEKDSDKLILAESRLSILGDDFKIEKKLQGKNLVGLEYEPLYPNKAPYKVVAGDFVSTEEGTGIVHIAPAFGDDDFQLSKKYDLPVLATTGPEGLMQTPGKAWDGVWFKKADQPITGDLKSRGLLFKTESYEHDYPFCWRCKNSLMYLARKAWWVDVNAVRPKLIANNEKINWFPEHIKHGRFGEWLKEKKNWAFSRERYWGTPLPVWRCEECKKWEAIGSLDELKKRGINSGNKYFMLRHGESENNKINLSSTDITKDNYKLTAKGRKQIEDAAKILLKKKIKPDLIFSSPFLRTRESAEIAAEIFGIETSQIKIDPRLSEVNTGIFSEKPLSEYNRYFNSPMEKFISAPLGGETLIELKKRVFESVSEMESRYKDKTILIVSHEDSIWMLWATALGKTNEASYQDGKAGREGIFIKNAEFMELNPYISALPRDEDFVLDFHKPYIDRVILKCSCGGGMRRVSEVCDAWFDSGAMPFTQDHFPFETKKVDYPADYITEGIDQTRGWFYSLLSVGTLLGREEPYKNVISLGHVLDKSGKKMSKSLGNVVDPMVLIEKYGADAARWYFFTVNQPEDSKLFREEDIKDTSRRFFMILWNVLQFWKMYADSNKKLIPTTSPKTKLLINKWVLLKLKDTIRVATEKLDNYNIVGAARDLENFIVEDISRWYIRRIRDVMKEENAGSNETKLVLAYLLGEISKLLAPFAPFIAEKIWMELQESPTSLKLRRASVHLQDWPVSAKASANKSRGKTLGVKSLKTPSVKERAGILNSMQEIRKIVGMALEARQKLGIKVRQPLQKITVRNEILKSADKNLLELIQDEINVKKVIFDNTLEDEVRLDTEITPALREEGILRDLLREIQSARKTAGLTPKDKISATLELPKEIFDVAKKYEKEIQKETNLKSAEFLESEEIKVSLR